MKIRCQMCNTVSEQSDEVLHNMHDVRCPGCNVTLRIVAVPRGVGRTEMPVHREQMSIVAASPHCTAEIIKDA